LTSKSALLRNRSAPISRSWSARPIRPVTFGSLSAAEPTNSCGSVDA